MSSLGFSLNAVRKKKRFSVNVIVVDNSQRQSRLLRQCRKRPFTVFFSFWNYVRLRKRKTYIDVYKYVRQWNKDNCLNQTAINEDLQAAIDQEKLHCRLALGGVEVDVAVGGHPSTGAAPQVSQILELLSLSTVELDQATNLLQDPQLAFSPRTKRPSESPSLRDRKPSTR